ncbi:MAG: hypothetical protein GXO80_02730 [Chlorobi bacterium]|nr:hypothetical protein [Chlorobiota bacterium]
MKYKLIIFIALLFAGFSIFSQDVNSSDTNNNLTFELSAGKIFSPYRFYKNHTGYEKFSFGVSKKLFKYGGAVFSQSYGRVFSKTTNNQTLVMTTTISPYITFFADKKINLRFSSGTGLICLSTKTLYDIYPINEKIYGMPIKGNIAVLYKLQNKLALNLNIDTHYSFLFTGNYKLLINDPYYYKTFFYSINIGINYTL